MRLAGAARRAVGEIFTQRSTPTFSQSSRPAVGHQVERIE
jgi:hypothetical protein